LLEHLGSITKVRPYQFDRQALHSLSAGFDRGRVAIQRDDPARGTDALANRTRVAASAQRSVENNLSRLWVKLFKHFAEQNGQML
jgi:hypothetical protein